MNVGVIAFGVVVIVLSFLFIRITENDEFDSHIESLGTDRKFVKQFARVIACVVGGIIILQGFCPPPG